MGFCNITFAGKKKKNAGAVPLLGLLLCLSGT